MIGNTIWRFNINRRVYEKDPVTGRGIGGPIWREHWQPQVVVGETTRSWITDHGAKAPKKGADSSWAFSEDEITRRAFVADNAYRIGEKVRQCKDYETLKAVAALVNYEEAK